MASATQQHQREHIADSHPIIPRDAIVGASRASMKPSWRERWIGAMISVTLANRDTVADARTGSAADGCHSNTQRHSDGRSG
jgi:hypothetical protein